MEQNRIFGIVEKCQKQDSLSDDVSEKLLHHLGYVLSLLELLVSWKSGAFIQSYTSLHNVSLDLNDLIYHINMHYIELFYLCYGFHMDSDLSMSHSIC